ncbi:MAG: V-type ATP synthase subunit D [Candidatus Omnitrophica bacterium]|nr:V-type ATP synthase subunit D [Candidatus Omnitrophota bacterium]
MKVKPSKGELKRQRDVLRRYERFLPTLQLKKQQLQMEVLHQVILLEEKKQLIAKKLSQIESWVGLLSGEKIKIREFLDIEEVVTEHKNIAGVDIPVFSQVRFVTEEYDLFLTPIWLDSALDAFKEILWLQEEARIIEQGIVLLRQELRIATQRVNLFEKVKIPEAQEAIRIIKIYIGDQMANSVGRSKIAKRKIEEYVSAGAAV